MMPKKNKVHKLIKNDNNLYNVKVQTKYTSSDHEQDTCKIQKDQYKTLRKVVLTRYSHVPLQCTVKQSCLKRPLKNRQNKNLNDRW